MNRIANTLAYLLLLVTGVARAQSPTSHAATGSALPVAITYAQSPGHHAVISYSQDRLEIQANDSSLYQILQDVAHRTGMKITGFMADQRVFGTFGPAPSASVLVDLLKGTGINMVLKETESGDPVELILTPRNGGPTPPAPPLAPETSVTAASVSIQRTSSAASGSSASPAAVPTDGRTNGIGSASDGMTAQQRQQLIQQLQQQQQAMRQR